MPRLVHSSAAAAFLTLLAAAPQAQSPPRFEELLKMHMPPDQDMTRSVAVGDVDGDGDADILCGNRPAAPFSTGQNRLYLNDGSARFVDATAAHMPADVDWTNSVVLGDVDGDGDLDLLCGNGPATSSGQNRLYINDGRGGFVDASALRMPADGDDTKSLALGDVDGDGDIDLVCGNGGQDRLYLNDGAGGFVDATANRLPVEADDTSSVALGDVDLDGDLDLVCGNSRAASSGQNRLYLNDGAGRFVDATATRMPIDWHWTSSVWLGDVDRDGDLDLVCGNSPAGSDGQDRLYFNDGTGRFADVTATHMPPESAWTLSIALGDIDGDGDLDLVCGNSPGVSSGQNRLYENDGTGRFADATTTRMPLDEDYTVSVALTDVEGDGDLDLVCGNGSIYPFRRSNSLSLNDGSGRLVNASAKRLPPDESSTNSAALGDVDGDGDLDIVFGNRPAAPFSGGQNRLYLNDGVARFVDATAARMPADGDDTLSLALGDVDGDGDLDLLCGNYNQQDRLYLNDGSGRFVDATTTRMPAETASTQALALGDVDADGDLDLVCGNTRQNRLYLNDGNGRFADATTTHMPADASSTRSLTLGDVDGDGDLDIVFGNTGRDRLYLNDGSGRFADETSTRLPADQDYALSVGLGDVDGDGDLDILCGNDAQRNRLYLNDGGGRFLDATAGQLPEDRDETNAVALGDVDGDGDLDVVYGNANICPPGGCFGQNRLLINLTRQFQAPLLLRVGQAYVLETRLRSALAGPAAVVLPYVSAATAQIPLGRFGTLRLDPASMIPLPLVVISPPEGTGSVTVQVPGDPSLVGATFYCQGLLIEHPGASRLTNATADATLR